MSLLEQKNCTFCLVVAKSLLNDLFDITLDNKSTKFENA